MRMKNSLIGAGMTAFGAEFVAGAGLFSYRSRSG